VIWFGNVAGLSQWRRGGYFTCSNDFYLLSRRLKGGGSQHPAKLTHFYLSIWNPPVEKVVALDVVDGGGIQHCLKPKFNISSPSTKTHKRDNKKNRKQMSLLISSLVFNLFSKPNLFSCYFIYITETVLSVIM
jgi:hypothetical protein